MASIVLSIGWMIGKHVVRLGIAVLEHCPETVRVRFYQAMIRRLGAIIATVDRRRVLREEIVETIEPAERFLVPTFAPGHHAGEDRFKAYQQRYIPFQIQPGERVLDIGSGAHPFPLATHHADLFLAETSHRHEAFKRTGLPLIVCDVEKLPYPDRSFDFVYCSHVLEHVTDPARSCRELMRVGRRGFIETPTRMSDIMFNYIRLQGHHLWHVTCVGGGLIFVEWEDRERRDTDIHEFFWMAKSKYKNPFQDLFHHHRDLFVNMMLWEESFPYFVFSKDGRLVETNSNVLSVHGAGA